MPRSVSMAEPTTTVHIPAHVRLDDLDAGAAVAQIHTDDDDYDDDDDANRIRPVYANVKV
jgi:uncharacterized protein (DUF849 family)